MKNYRHQTIVLLFLFLGTALYSQEYNKLWQQHTSGIPVAYANVDADPNIEILSVRGSKFYIYDGVNGTLEFQITSYVGIYSVAAVDLNNDGVAEVIISAEKTSGWDILEVYSYGSLGMDESGTELFGFEPLNFPNPFSENTTIRYEVIPDNARVLIKIYDQLGKEIKSIDEGMKSNGRHEYLWDGKNNSGEEIKPGPYYYNIEIGGEPISSKMIKL